MKHVWRARQDSNLRPSLFVVRFVKRDTVGCSAEIRFLEVFRVMRRDVAVCGPRQRCCETTFLMMCSRLHEDDPLSTFVQCRRWDSNPHEVALTGFFESSTLTDTSRHGGTRRDKTTLL